MVKSDKLYGRCRSYEMLFACNRGAVDPAMAAKAKLRFPGLSVLPWYLVVLIALAGCADGSSLPTSQRVTESVAASASAPLNFVVIGDSIPYNSPDDCPNCTGFVDRYGKAIGESLQRPVMTSNLSEHTGLTLAGLLAELPSLESQLAEADVILVGIAHNSIALNSDMPCGATFDESTNQLSDWSKVNARCAKTAAETSRPQFDQLFSRLVDLRAGKPTIFLTVNKYSDWIGWQAAHLTADQQKRTVLQHDVWNTMLCDVAEANHFNCVDIYHAFNGPHGTKAAGDLLAADYTHPSDKGNALIAKLLVARGYAPLG
jgi:lysophospholipase L1-like esterase